MQPRAFESSHTPEIEPTIQEIVDTLTRCERIKFAWNDPTVREALRASYRTLVNSGISLVDFIPGVGGIPSWAADIGKVIDPWVRKHLGVGTDTTPDVSKSIAITTEILEPLSMGVFPTHAIETSLQMAHDFGRITEGVKEAIKIIRGEQTTTEVIEAANEFGVNL